MITPILLALTLAQAGSAPAGETPPPGSVTRAPSLRQFVEAEYPPEAFAAKRTASVLMAIDLDEAGAVTAVKILESGGAEFDAAAIHAAARFQFEGAEIDGKPAPVEITYRYEFVIKEEVHEAPQEGRISLFGVVRERGTRALVKGATIQVGDIVTTTSGTGAFELRGLSPGPVTVKVASPDHNPYEVLEEILAGRSKEVEYRLTRRHYDPFEATVRGEKNRKEVAVHTLHLEEVRSLPGTQGDALKVIQNLPGVARAPFGLGLLVVRGAAPQDTKVYLDGIEIPLLFHFGGLTSVVNSDILSSLDFYPGNFGARYGRATAGVVEIKTRDGKKDFHGAAQMDVYDGTALLEMPLGDGSLMISGRRSWVDQVLQVVLPIVAPQVGSDLRVAPRYFDYQLKLTQPLAGGTASLMAFGADDILAFLTQDDTVDRPTFFLETQFHRLSAHYRREWGPAISNHATAAFGWDQADIIQGTNFGIRTTIWSGSLRDAFVWRPSSTFNLEAGVDAQLRNFTYSLYAPPQRATGTAGGAFGGGAGTSATEAGESVSGTWASPALYLEADWRPLPRLRLVPGARLDHDSRLTHAKVWFDPRASAFYELTDSTTLTAAAGLYQEPPQVQELTQLFGNPTLGPSHAVHYALGVKQQLPWDTNLDVTGFFKELSSIPSPTRRLYSDGTLVHLDNTGKGEVLGLEVLLRRQLAQGLYGWVAYTLSQSLRQDDPTVPTYPRWHLYGFDQTHILTFIASYRTLNDWIFGTRLRYVSGNPYTPTVGHIYNADRGNYVCIPGAVNSSRFPGFFQADARIDKRFVFDRWMFAVYLDVQNVTNRDNAEARFANFDCTAFVPISGLPIFPALGLRGEW